MSMLDRVANFRGSILDQAGGLLVLAAFLIVGPLCGPVGVISAAIMAVVAVLAAPMLLVGFVEAVREKFEK